MGIFKAAGDTFRRRQFINDLNRRFKTGFVVNQDPYLVNFKTAITTDGLYLRGVVQNDYSLNDIDVKDMGQAVLSNEMVKRELFALGFVGLQIVGKNQPIGLKWNLGDIDVSLRNDHPYLSMFGSAGESIGQMMNERKNAKELEAQQNLKLIREAQKRSLEEERRRIKEKQEQSLNQQTTKKEQPKQSRVEKKCFACSKTIFRHSVKCPYCGTQQTK